VKTNQLSNRLWCWF